MSIELKPEDRETIVNLLSEQSAVYVDGPRAYFLKLVSASTLPMPFKISLSGVWGGDPYGNAGNLLDWALAKEINPADPQYTTLGSILKPLLTGEAGLGVGVGDQHTLAALIAAYRLYLAESLLKDLVTKYGISALVDGTSPPVESLPAPDLSVHSFMEAAQALQSRLYNILELQGLGALRSKYPSGEYAEEILYLIARYFGWECVLRKGAYGKDKKVITSADRIREAFATGKYGTGAFEVYRPKQEAIGQLVVKRPSGHPATEYEAITLYEFQERLLSSPLSSETWIQETLAVLKAARSAADLKGRERLAIIQDALVDLLEYLEAQQKYSVFSGKRERALSAMSPGSVRPVSATPAPTSPVDTGGYDLAVVRDLLLAAFTAPDLRRLVLYTSNKDLRSLVQEFSPSDGLASMVDKTIEHCQVRDLLSVLLDEVQRANRRQYDRFAGRQRG